MPEQFDYFDDVAVLEAIRNAKDSSEAMDIVHKVRRAGQLEICASVRVGIATAVHANEWISDPNLSALPEVAVKLIKQTLESIVGVLDNLFVELMGEEEDE